MYRDVPKVYIPIFYFDQKISLKDDLATILIIIQNLPDISTIASLILGGLGVMSFFWLGLKVSCSNPNAREQTKNKLPQNISESVPLNAMH